MEIVVLVTRRICDITPPLLLSENGTIFYFSMRSYAIHKLFIRHAYIVIRFPGDLFIGGYPVHGFQIIDSLDTSPPFREKLLGVGSHDLQIIQLNKRYTGSTQQTKNIFDIFVSHALHRWSSCTCAFFPELLPARVHRR